LIAYITVVIRYRGHLKVVPLLAECGCDIVELGIPFSDPMPTAPPFSAPALKRWKTGYHGPMSGYRKN